MIFAAGVICQLPGLPRHRHAGRQAGEEPVGLLRRRPLGADPPCLRVRSLPPSSARWPSWARSASLTTGYAVLMLVLTPAQRVGLRAGRAALRALPQAL